MSGCLPPQSIIVTFAATFTAGGNITTELAAALNSAIVQPICMLSDGAFGYYTQDEDSGFSVLPGTYTINGVSCKVGVSGLLHLYSTALCGWGISGPPTPYFEWDYWSVGGSPYEGFLMEWRPGTTGIYDGGPEDAYCVLASLSALTPADSGTVSANPDVYTEISCTLTISLGSCGGTASTFPFRSPNATWTAIGFGGSYSDAPGSAGSPNFSKDSCVIAGYTGNRPTVTANRAGVVHITADSVSQDCIFQIFRNATSVYSYGTADCGNPGDNPPSALSTTFSVSVGDVITLGDPTDYNVCTNIAIWWTAT
jgi:hypothetical protein